MTNAFRECALDSVTRKARFKVNAQHSSGQRTKRFSGIEDVLNERRGESKYCSGPGDGPITRGVSFQRYNREYNSLHHISLFARDVS